ncbi:MAG: tRNA (adenosine(37)-N6)-threonylcarbamoyltransferase complex ATPase subunit type 1 TsaE [Nitrospirae bacterium]|nr:tRNA (adenosine(37)-N6)-threonylcarbamoyltransferase complex ATPase subunit type 1 TsaE [Nitrospirota bacterium]
MKVVSNKEGDTKNIGRRLGKLLKSGDTVCLYGELGSGKTTFIKGIGTAIGIPEREISSSSFIIVGEHKAKDMPFYHIDLYRLENAKDIEETGIYELIGGNGIAVIEWAEKLSHVEDVIKVSIKILSKEKREILISGIDEKKLL